MSEFEDLDELDKEILRRLSSDATESNRKIAEDLQKSPTTINNHFNDLKNRGIIRKTAIKIDYEKLGFDIVALIELTISKAKMIEVERDIATDPNVFAVYDITGEYDAVVLARFLNRHDLNVFLKKINSYEYVVRTNTHLVLNIVKDEMDFSAVIEKTSKK